MGALGTRCLNSALPLAIGYSLGVFFLGGDLTTFPVRFTLVPHSRAVTLSTSSSPFRSNPETRKACVTKIRGRPVKPLRELRNSTRSLNETAVLRHSVFKVLTPGICGH